MARKHKPHTVSRKQTIPVIRTRSLRKATMPSPNPKVGDIYGPYPDLPSVIGVAKGLLPNTITTVFAGADLQFYLFVVDVKGVTPPPPPPGVSYRLEAPPGTTILSNTTLTACQAAVSTLPANTSWQIIDSNNVTISSGTTPPAPPPPTGLQPFGNDWFYQGNVGSAAPVNGNLQIRLDASGGDDNNYRYQTAQIGVFPWGGGDKPMPTGITNIQSLVNIIRQQFGTGHSHANIYFGLYYKCPSAYNGWLDTQIRIETIDGSLQPDGTTSTYGGPSDAGVGANGFSIAQTSSTFDLDVAHQAQLALSAWGLNDTATLAGIEVGAEGFNAPDISADFLGISFTTGSAPPPPPGPKPIPVPAGTLVPFTGFQPVSGNITGNSDGSINTGLARTRSLTVASSPGASATVNFEIANQITPPAVDVDGVTRSGVTVWTNVLDQCNQYFFAWRADSSQPAGTSSIGAHKVLNPGLATLAQCPGTGFTFLTDAMGANAFKTIQTDILDGNPHSFQVVRIGPASFQIIADGTVIFNVTDPASTFTDTGTFGLRTDNVNARLFFALSGGTVSPPPPPGQISTVVVVAMENTDYSAVFGTGALGSAATPFLNTLLAQGATIPRYNEHIYYNGSSEASYIAMLGGDTFGASNGTRNIGNASTPTLSGLLEAKGLTWEAYREDSNGRGGDHFAYLDFVATMNSPHVHSGASPNDIVSVLGQANPPNFVWFTPSDNHNMHDNSVSSGSNYLQSFIPAILNTPVFQQGKGLLIIWWDEWTGNSTEERVPIVFLGAAKKGYVSQNVYEHYDVLRTIENIFGLSPMSNGPSQPPGDIGAKVISEVLA